MGPKCASRRKFHEKFFAQQRAKKLNLKVEECGEGGLLHWHLSQKIMRKHPVQVLAGERMIHER